MMANLSADCEIAEDVAMRGGGLDISLPRAARRATKIQLPGVRPTNTRSLFIFSDDNFIRKYAQIIIEWIYPFKAVMTISV